MNRKEEIQQKAREEAWYIADTSQTKEEAVIRGYCLGVAYADRTMLDRDESGFATEECLESMRKAIPFVFVATKEVYVAVGNENDFNVYEDGFKTDRNEVQRRARSVGENIFG